MTRNETKPTDFHSAWNAVRGSEGRKPTHSTVGQNQAIVRHRIIHFPKSSAVPVTKRMSERSVRVKRAVHSKRTNEWPSTYVPILGRSEPLCNGAQCMHCTQFSTLGTLWNIPRKATRQRTYDSNRKMHNCRNDKQQHLGLRTETSFL